MICEQVNTCRHMRTVTYDEDDDDDDNGGRFINFDKNVRNLII